MSVHERKSNGKMSEISEPATGEYGRNPESMAVGVANSFVADDGISPDTDKLLERMVERSNMMNAYRKVVGNKGSAGIDNMSVDELKSHLNRNWTAIRKALLEGRYIPQTRRERRPSFGNPHGHR